MPWTTAYAGNRATRHSHSAIAANATNNTDALRISGFSKLSVQVVHAGHTDTSTWELQSSNDGTNFDTIAGSSTTTSGAAGSDTLMIDPVAFREVRVRITEADAAAASTLTVFLEGLKL